MDSIDWQLNKTHSQSLEYLLEKEINTDVTFRVGENQEAIKAHKFMLSCRSPVFDRMLNGHFKETEEDPVINDIDPETFKAVLRYCYYDCADIKEKIAFTTLCAAKMYMLPLLEDIARNIVNKSLDASNILKLYKYSTSTNDEGLLKYCQKYLKSNLSTSVIWEVYQHAFGILDETVLEICRKIFQSTVSKVRQALQDKAFLNIKQDLLLDFLHINDIFDKTEKSYADVASCKGPDNVKYKQHCGIFISEIELFKACNSWAEAECLRQDLKPTGVNKRTVLGDALFLVRFPTMLHQDLANIVCPTGILTEDETVKGFQHQYKEKGDESSLDFPTKQRHSVIHCLTVNNYVSLEPTEKFLVRRIWFLDEGTKNITIKDQFISKTYMGGKSKQSHYQWTDKGGSPHLYHYVDIEPVLLEAGTKYTIHITEVGKTIRITPQEGSKHIDAGWPGTIEEMKTSPEPVKTYSNVLTVSLV